MAFDEEMPDKAEYLRQLMEAGLIGEVNDARRCEIQFFRVQIIY
jgi:hypothetical protein